MPKLERPGVEILRQTWYNRLAMTKQLIFIDDSGDPGFKGSASSPFLVMAGVLFHDSNSASFLNKNITDLRKMLGWKCWHEFKFSKATKKIRIKFLNEAKKYNFDIYAVHIDKRKYFNTLSSVDGGKLYNWTVKELLSMMPLSEAYIVIDGRYGKNYKLKLKSYMRKQLNNSNKKIVFDVRDSLSDNLIQLADMIAGSINRSLQNEKADAKTYVRVINHKIIELKELDLDNGQGGKGSIP